MDRERDNRRHPDDPMVIVEEKKWTRGREPGFSSSARMCTRKCWFIGGAGTLQNKEQDEEDGEESDQFKDSRKPPLVRWSRSESQWRQVCCKEQPKLKENVRRWRLVGKNKEIKEFLKVCILQQVRCEWKVLEGLCNKRIERPAGGSLR